MRLLALLLTLGCAAAHAAPFDARFEEIKRTATPAELYTLLYALPKGGDLHNHSGAERPEWIYAVCTDPARNGGDTFYTRARFTDAPDAIAPAQRFHNIRQHDYDALPAATRAEYVRLDALTPAERAAWCDSLRLDAPGEGRAEFFTVLWPRRGEIGRSLPVVTESLVENLKAFGAEHLAYLETMFIVAGMTDNAGRPIPVEEAVAFVRRRLAQPDVAATGVTVRFQTPVLRFLPDSEERLAAAYAFVDAHRDLWVSLNLVGIEENDRGEPARFLATFRRLRARYPTLPLSIHAGEMDVADTHVRDTLLLGASRIGHGINLIKDPATLLLLAQTRRVLVEVNLISNRLLEYTPDLAQHPFPEYLRTGVPVCLNTDDRGMFDSNLTDEYFTAVTTFNLSWAEVVALGRNSLAYSFVQPDVKARLLAAYERAVAEFEAKYLPADSLAQLAAVKPVAYGYARRNWHFPFAR
ncbi:MAG: adenosine deaminase [Opitutae bacterium]|nr:adenosine deaminase [Opitutae bacterium]